MIYTNVRKSKQKLKPKAEREQYAQWLASHQPTKTLRVQPAESFTYKLSTPPGRETRHIPSLNSGAAVATKAPTKFYTGDKMIGIATLHKSNAVPVFNNMEAVEISKMRR